MKVNLHNKEEGAALIIVLMLVASLSVTALALTQTMSRAVGQAGSAAARDNAMWALVGAESAALSLLKQQSAIRKNVDMPDEAWLAQSITLPLDGGVIQAQFTDRSACFNVNQLVTGGDGGGLATDQSAVRRFGLYVEALGADRRTGETLGSALADFMDADGSPEPGGAEDYIYSVGSAPFVTAGTWISDISEIRSVYSWTGATYRALQPHLCARPKNGTFGLLNVNTLTADDAPILFVALDGRIDLSSLERLIDSRPVDGYPDAAAFFDNRMLTTLNPPLKPAISGRFATYASYIEFYAEVFYGVQVFEITSLIESAGGGDYRVVSRRIGAKDL